MNAAMTQLDVVVVTSLRSPLSLWGLVVQHLSVKDNALPHGRATAPITRRSLDYYLGPSSSVTRYFSFSFSRCR